MGFARSAFRDFETYLRFVVGLNDDDIQLISEQYNSSFFTYEIPPGIYTIKDTSEIVYTVGHHAGTLRIAIDEVGMETKLISNRFGGTFGWLRFNGKTFSILHWILHHIGITNLLMPFILIA